MLRFYFIYENLSTVKEWRVFFFCLIIYPMTEERRDGLMSFLKVCEHKMRRKQLCPVIHFQRR